MRAQERRHGHRFIMRVPLRFHPTKKAALREEIASSMNISTHGVYFATDQELAEGLLLQLHLKMPKEIVGDDVEEWSFTGRVAHVEPLSRQNGKSGIGVQFLFYEVPPPSIPGGPFSRPK
jgi:PilZ domain-containing protein